MNATRRTSTDATHREETNDVRRVTGPHHARDATGGIYRYYECHRCGTESTDSAMRDGCFHCGATHIDSEEDHE